MHEKTVSCIGFVAIALALAAAPTTRPAADLSRTVLYTSKSAKVSFRVPKGWERTRSNLPEDEVFVFDIDPLPKPVPGRKMSTAARQAAVPPLVKTSVWVMFGEPCERQRVLANVISDDRKALGATGTKFTEDRATTMAGQPAWVLGWTDSGQAERNDIVGGKRKVTPVKWVEWRRRIEWIQNDRLVQISLHAPPAAKDRVEKAAAAVVDTFEWTAKQAD